MEYWIRHRPTDPREDPNFRADLIIANGTLPSDVFSKPRAFFVDYDNYKGGGKLSADMLSKMQGNPDLEVTVYRGAPGSTLHTGDWVSLSKDYAICYTGNGINCEDPSSTLHSYRVKAKDLSFDGDSIFELGYWGSDIEE